MRRQITCRGTTVQEALQTALRQLGVEAHDVTVEVIQKPQAHLFGLVTVPAEVKVTVRQKDPDPNEQGEWSPLPGQVWIRDGEFGFLPPQEGNTDPILLVDPKISARYDDEEVNNQCVLSKGIEPLTIELPEGKQPEREMSIIVSADKLQARLQLRRREGVEYYLEDHKPNERITVRLGSRKLAPRPFTREEIAAKLEELGITYGIQLDTLTDEDLAQEDYEGIIAAGIAPKEPEQPQISLLFERFEDAEPDLNTLRVDHLEVRGVISVDAGQLLAEISPGTPGEEGRDVFGQPIPTEPLQEVKLVAGEGVRISEDGVQAYALTAGLPVMEDGTLKVRQVYELDGNADISTGHIRFRGEVVVRGNVTEKIKVVAQEGGITVTGMVTGAFLQADRDINVSGNVVASELAAGGLTVIYIRLLAFSHEISTQLSQLMKGFYLIRERAVGEDGKLFKNLMELKYHELPVAVRELVGYYKQVAHRIEMDVNPFMKQIADVFLDRGPLEIESIEVVEDVLEKLLYWEQVFKQKSQQIADIQAKYLQNSKVEASGTVRIVGQGAYYSRLIAGCGALVENGIFRGGEITVDEGDVKVKELGGPTGIATTIFIVHDGRIEAKKVHPNVTLSIQGEKYRFDQETSSVKAFVRNGSLKVFSGSLELV